MLTPLLVLLPVLAFIANIPPIRPRRESTGASALREPVGPATVGFTEMVVRSGFVDGAALPANVRMFVRPLGDGGSLEIVASHIGLRHVCAGEDLRFVPAPVLGDRAAMDVLVRLPGSGHVRMYRNDSAELVADPWLAGAA